MTTRLAQVRTSSVVALQTMACQAVHVCICGDGVSPDKRAQEPQRGAPGEPVEDGPLDDQQREAEPHDRLAAPAGQTMHDR